MNDTENSELGLAPSNLIKIRHTKLGPGHLQPLHPYHWPTLNNGKNVLYSKKTAQGHRYLAELKGAAASAPNEAILINMLALQEAITIPATEEVPD